MTQSSKPEYRITALDVSDQTTIVDLFAPFADSPWSMLLDSGNSQHPTGRFDFFVANPVSDIVTVNGTSTLRFAGNRQTTTHDDPLSALQALLTATFVPINEPAHIEGVALPFHSGAVGLFGYDLGRSFEDFDDTDKADYQTPDMAVGLYSWCVCHDNRYRRFYLIHRSDFPAPSVQELLQNKQTDTKSAFALSSQWQSNLDRDAYLSCIDSIHQYLRSGDCYQVNMAQRFQASFAGDSWQAYLTLRHSNQAPFSAFIRLPPKQHIEYLS